MAKRKRDEYFIEGCEPEMDPEQGPVWTKIKLHPDAEIHSVQDAVKYVKDHDLEGTFRVGAIKAEFDNEIERKSKVTMR